MERGDRVAVGEELQQDHIGLGLINRTICHISARIPHPSKIKDF